MQKRYGRSCGVAFDNDFSWIGYDFDKKTAFYSTENPMGLNLMYPIGDDELGYFEKLGLWYKAVQRREDLQPKRTLKRVLDISEATSGKFFQANLEVILRSSSSE